ncbi:hypothetical protein DDB_G0292754 [Dictyostelium discoideum AX4]|uniref:Uncharacterized protein n=1 Tax=Dictyostelium discoideum TaxID=44689 RepID=Q54CR6_DICDI|nr:hypothetical protein DDB_G0292754 [Dictyostelium discoideum AX4]EAL61051.1 hypothetical protein DDB_G0292754 [Dictyostelium discoideum AX4]|eukprot:XP_629475.1 hypothetical protein DDB_G0292754 [Dictyostelium discoideum AX4]
MLSPQPQPEIIPLPAMKVGGEHGMRVPKPKHTKVVHSPPPRTQFATGLDPTPLSPTLDGESKPEKKESNQERERKFSQEPTISENHKTQSRPLNQPR